MKRYFVIAPLHKSSLVVSFFDRILTRNVFMPFLLTYLPSFFGHVVFSHVFADTFAREQIQGQLKTGSSRNNCSLYTRDFLKKLHFLLVGTHLHIRIRGVAGRNVSFSENLRYLINERPLRQSVICK